MKKKFFITDIPLKEMKKVTIKPYWFTFSKKRTDWGDPKNCFWTQGEIHGTMIAVYNSLRQQYLVHAGWIIGLPKIEQPF